MPNGLWSAHWNVGDTVTAAEMNKGVGSVFDSTLGVAAASFDVSGIVGGYAHLLIKAQLRGSVASTAADVWLRFNNDSTAAHYHWQTSDAVSTTQTDGDAATGAAQLDVGTCPGANSLANSAADLTIHIPNYAATTFLKSVSGLSYAGEAASFAAGFGRVRSFGGTWNSNAAITRITLLPSSGNFVAGSRLTIYALGA